MVRKNTKKEGIGKDIRKGIPSDRVATKHNTTERYVKAIESEMAKTREEKTTRPTPVNRVLYFKFGNKCRNDGLGIRDALEGIMHQYIDGKITF